MVGDLVAGFDTAHRLDAHHAPVDHGLGVGPAGVVGITPKIAPARAVERVVLVELVHVAGTLRLAALRFRVGNLASGIADDELAFPDGSGGEQAEPGLGSADPKRTAGHGATYIWIRGDSNP